MLQCSGIKEMILQCSGIEEVMLQCSGIEEVILQCSGIYEVILQCSGIEEVMLQCSGIEEMILQCSGIEEVMLQCSGIEEVILQCRHTTAVALQCMEEGLLKASRGAALSFRAGIERMPWPSLFRWIPKEKRAYNLGANKRSFVRGNTKTKEPRTIFKNPLFLTLERVECDEQVPRQYKSNHLQYGENTIMT